MEPLGASTGARTAGKPMTNRSAELLALSRLDEASVALQKQGRYLEALESMERGLVLRQHFYGTDSDEVWSACKTLGEMW